MQVFQFSDGGFVAHRVTRAQWPKARFSVWFDAAGKILDAEALYGHERSRNATFAQRESLAELGPVWKDRETQNA